jgi:hypothetical protein
MFLSLWYNTLSTLTVPGFLNDWLFCLAEQTILLDKSADLTSGLAYQTGLVTVTADHIGLPD